MERVNREIPTFGIRDWRTKLKAALACKIFDTMISPILTYNSEIWGVYAKRYLEVNNKASNIACRTELGRFPLNITINQKILKYILYIQSKDEESLVKQAFFNVIRLTL